MKGYRKADVVQVGKAEHITMYVSDDDKRLLLAFEVDPRGLSKTDVRVLTRALKQISEDMAR